VVAHPDDETVSCGGAILRHVARGDHVTVLVACNRAYDHKYDAVAIAQEMMDCHEAQRILGYQKNRWLGRNDERLGEDMVGFIAELEEAANEIKPHVVYIPWRGDSHGDHRALHDAMMTVCRPWAAPGLQALLACESGSSSPFHAPFVPTVYVDIEAHLERKIDALQCYRREARDFPHPRSPGGVRALAAKRGCEAGLRAAEAFMLLRGITR